MADMGLLREKLRTIIADQRQVEEICVLFENLDRMEEEERRRRQMEGIRKAKEEGKKLGRPKIQEPEDFLRIAEAWEKKEISAPEAAKICGMGSSTFYRRVRILRERKEKQERGEEAC